MEKAERRKSWRLLTRRIKQLRSEMRYEWRKWLRTGKTVESVEAMATDKPREVEKKAG